MTETLSRWLELREAADWLARSDELARRVAGRMTDPVVRVLDLGTGGGSNVRYLVDRLPPRQQWLAVDRDPDLLAELTRRFERWAAARSWRVSRSGTGCRLEGPSLGCVVEPRLLDLGSLPEALFAGRHLVTASALLDLVSAEWLQILARRCRSVGAAALFAITYDGRWSCDPPEPEDELVRGLFNEHQTTDKGLGGIAAGPDGWRLAERFFSAAGYHVERAESDWTIGPDGTELQRQLVTGWATAAAEVAPGRAGAIADWLTRRRAHIVARRSRIRVGHSDMAAWLERPV
jgi:hypothetical protein